jgi:hypothetical protein
MTYVLGIIMLPCYVNGIYKYITIGTSKHYVQKWMLCNIVPTIKTNGYVLNKVITLIIKIWKLILNAIYML